MPVAWLCVCVFTKALTDKLREMFVLKEWKSRYDLTYSSCLSISNVSLFFYILPHTQTLTYTQGLSLSPSLSLPLSHSSLSLSLSHTHTSLRPSCTDDTWKYMGDVYFHWMQTLTFNQDSPSGGPPMGIPVYGTVSLIDDCLQQSPVSIVALRENCQYSIVGAELRNCAPIFTVNFIQKMPQRTLTFLACPVVFRLSKKKQIPQMFWFDVIVTVCFFMANYKRQYY